MWFPTAHKTGDQVMTYIHIISLPLQVPESESANFINEFVEQMRSMILPWSVAP
jgi:hypothetical protein